MEYAEYLERIKAKAVGAFWLFSKYNPQQSLNNKPVSQKHLLLSIKLLFAVNFHV